MRIQSILIIRFGDPNFQKAGKYIEILEQLRKILALIDGRAIGSHLGDFGYMKSRLLKAEGRMTNVE